jgi:hypothetical protein
MTARSHTRSHRKATERERRARLARGPRPPRPPRRRPRWLADDLLLDPTPNTEQETR